jgi:transcriptional regulator with XRE-family HTH domain
VQSFDLSFGKAHVSYPEATNESCTAALLLDVDPVALVRTRRGPSGEGGTLDQYVNDRPYVASSFLSVAIARVLASALGGASKGRTELVDEPLPLVARITVLPCRGGEDILNRLFEPLGYTVRAEHHTSGNVYVVDSSNNAVTEILAAGGYTTVNTLAALRKQKGMTQQQLSEKIGVHVVQLRRYEAGSSQPTLDVVRCMAVALGISADALLFDKDERGPDASLKLQFEAVSRFDPETKKVVQQVLDSMILQQEARRWSAGR